jgi:hypothetical protein
MNMRRQASPFNPASYSVILPGDSIFCMSRQIKVGLGVILFVALSWLALRSHEPTYQGKRLSVWLEQLDRELPNGNYVGTNSPAASAIQQIGTNAIPCLRQMLDARDSRLKTKLIDWCDKQTLVKVHLARANDWRRRAAFATFCLGPRGSTLMPQVMTLFRDSDYSVAQTITRVVGCMGYGSPETLPGLIAAVADSSPDVRARSAFALCQLNTCFVIIDTTEDPRHGFPESRCKRAVPVLLTALHDADAEVRRVAAMALQQIEPNAATSAGEK